LHRKQPLGFAFCGSRNQGGSIDSEAREEALIQKHALALGIVILIAVQISPVHVRSSLAQDQFGVASVYSTESGTVTASGQKLHPGSLTAAHRSLPFGSKVRVTNAANGRSVVVTINDRGPFVRGRVIDVTPAAARALGFSGLTRVKLARES
jgi:rare lipoprotein A